MRFNDTARRAGRSLKNAKMRTILTSLAIAVGAFTITLALAAGEGGRQYAQEIVTSNTDVRELFVQPSESEDFDFSSPKPYSDEPSMSYGGGFSVPLLTEKDLKTIEDLDYVESVAPVYNLSAKYIAGPNDDPYQAGIEAFNKSIRQEYIAGSNNSIDQNGIIIPDTYVQVLGFSSPESAIGEEVDVVVENTASFEERTFSLPVVGVVKRSALAATTTGAGVQVYRDVVADMYEHAYAGTPLEGAFVGLVVTADKEENAAPLKDAIEAAGEYSARTAEDLMSFLFQFINVLQFILIGFGALAVLTSVFGIINTQYISVLERTQQIGLMKALGMEGRDVGRLFKLEAAWIGFLGGALGAGGAWLAGAIANPWISDTLSLGESQLLIFQPLATGVVIGGLILVAVGSGILPARKASKLDPIEALRTE